jgi:hypothetical protein
MWDTGGISLHLFYSFYIYIFAAYISQLIQKIQLIQFQLLSLFPFYKNYITNLAPRQIIGAGKHWKKCYENLIIS